MPFRARLAALAAASVTAAAVLLSLPAAAGTLPSELAVGAVVVSSMASGYEPARPAGQRLVLSFESGGALDLRTVGLYVGEERYLDAGGAERAIAAQSRATREPVVVSLVF